MAGRKITVRDEEILAVFTESSDPALDTQEIADAIGMTKPGASKRLHKLVDKGYVGTKKFGSARGWWLTDAGREYLAEDDEDYHQSGRAL